MNMSLLMVVQPLLDAGRNMTSGTGGKNQGNDASNPFQALLKDQMVSREDKPVTTQPPESKETAKEPSATNQNQGASGEDAAKEPVKEGETAEVTLPGKADEKIPVEEDAAVLAQIMAAAAGAQIVPVEPAPGNDTTELADEALVLAAAGEEGAGGKKMRATDEIEIDTAKTGRQEGGDEAAYGKVQADAEQNVKATADKPAAEVAALKPVATEVPAPAAKPVAEQPVAQAQQPVPTMSTQQVQQATVAPMTVEANPAAARVMQQMGTPEWNQAISQRVLWMVGQEQQSASLTLNPPELGPVRVVVSVSNNNASANFFSANPDVRHALEGSLPRLREMMEGAGIQLGQAQVGAENSGNQQSQQASSGGRTAGVAGDDGDIGNLSAVTGVPAPRQTITKGLVDTFA